MKRKGVGGALPSNKVLTTLAVLVLVSLVVALATFLHTGKRDTYDEQYLIRIAEQQVLAQRVAKYASTQIRADLRLNPGVRYQGL